MWKLSSLVWIVLVSLAAAQRSGNTTSLWKTLRGDRPLVVARGGFSGLFPDSSDIAYTLATQISLPDVILWCDVQLTKDGAGICFPRLTLDNGSTVANAFEKSSTYPVNGASTSGYFTVDFTLSDLANVFLIQGIYSRSERFDQSLLPILTVQDVVKTASPPGLWLNVQHDSFFSQHKLSMRSFVLSTSKKVIIKYISSPEVNFLRSIMARFRPSITKLVFQFLGRDDVEASTNVTYGSLLNNLTFIKTFASGILVPKNYIWPMDDNLYLQSHTSLVLDAHKVGLEVFAANFANDFMIAYNYSYDPIAEYLSFIDNGDFSVDGVLSDFPITPSEAIDCFSHLGRNNSGQAKPLVISNEGASGDYPGCSSLAYAQAISDGVNVIDCPVQMTKDGIPFCLGSINLLDRTDVGQSPFNNLSMNIPELKSGGGIFSFSLTWSEIQSLTPVISNPYQKYVLYRNPNFRKSGKLLTLSDFLALSNNATSVSGVLISIEHAAYLAEKQGLSVTDAVLDALDKAGYSNQTMKKVMIQSSNSSVLIKVKEKSNYELLYLVDEKISDVLDSTIMDIKKFANSVVILKASVYSVDYAFLVGVTNVVKRLQKAKLPVYVKLFNNEFVSQPWDFFGDPTVEINAYATGSGVDGVVTSFPGTTARYKKNRCLGLGNKTPEYMSPVEPGLVNFLSQQSMPPARAPSPVLTDSDVVESPLPPAVEKPPPPSGNGVTAPPPSGNGSTAVAPTASSGQSNIVACIFLSSLAILLATLLAF